MHWFTKEFKEGIEKHCVGATIVSIEASGTFKEEKDIILGLDNGIFCSFNTGQGGLDGETFYSVGIGNGKSASSILNRSTWDPSGFTRLNENISFSTKESVVVSSVVHFSKKGEARATTSF